MVLLELIGLCERGVEGGDREKKILFNFTNSEKHIFGNVSVILSKNGNTQFTAEPFIALSDHELDIHVFVF